MGVDPSATAPYDFFPELIVAVRSAVSQRRAAGPAGVSHARVLQLRSRSATSKGAFTRDHIAAPHCGAARGGTSPRRDAAQRHRTVVHCRHCAAPSSCLLYTSPSPRD